MSSNDRHWHIDNLDILSGEGPSVRDECHRGRPFYQRISITYLAIAEDSRGSRVSNQRRVATGRLVSALSGYQQSDHERRAMSKTRSPLRSGSTPINSTSLIESEHGGRRKVPLIERIMTVRRKDLSDRMNCYSTEKIHGPGRRRRRATQTAQLSRPRILPFRAEQFPEDLQYRRKNRTVGTPRSRSPYFPATLPTHDFPANLWRDTFSNGSIDFEKIFDSHLTTTGG
jgi:hypothetical protein